MSFFKNLPASNHEKNNQLKSLPISMFGSVMGLSGLALGWRLANHLFHTPPWISEFIGIIAAIDFFIILIAYSIKVFRYQSEVKSEISHPIKGNFLGTFTIAILLLSDIVLPYGKVVGETAWIIGAILTFTIAYFSVSHLLAQKQDIHYLTPAMMIPGVGVLNIPVTGGQISFEWVHQVNILAFSIGGIWALILIILIFFRLLYHDPLPNQLIPSLMILFAPFSVGFLGYVNGVIYRIDLFASILFYFGLFLFCVLYFKVFRRGLPFGPSWWAVSFPMAALSNTAIEYAGSIHNWLTMGIASLLLALVTITIGVLLIRTLLHLFRGTYFISK